MKAGEGFKEECAKVVNARGPIDVGGCVITSAGDIQFLQIKVHHTFCDFVKTFLNQFNMSFILWDRNGMVD